MDPNSTTEEIEFELPHFFRKYRSGRIERLRGTDVVPASSDPTTGVTSKDVTINPTTNLTARLYLPPLSDEPSKKLPILVYFHGGGFIIETAFSPSYHNYLNALSAKSGALIVSVDYRRAPEHPLPIAYDDSLEALKWVASKSDPWVSDHGDLTRLFLSGDSAGANIAHHVAMRAGTDVNISGVALVHPYFWGSEPVGEETTDVATRGFIEMLWKAVCPETAGADDPLINPMAPAAPSMKELKCKRVVVFVAGQDTLKERGRVYVEKLAASGWGGEAEFVVDEGVNHVYHLTEPNGEKALAKMEKMAAFLKG